MLAFFLFKGLGKIPWLADSSLLANRLQGWLEQATPMNRWYIELLLPGVPLFSRLVVIGELGLAAALIAGLCTRPVALRGFLMVLNFHLATGELFQHEFLVDGSGLPVLGGLLAVALGGGGTTFVRGAFRRHTLFALCSLVGACSTWFAATSTGAVSAAMGQRSERTVWSGVFTAAQAKRGEQVYKESCSYCHRDDLSGGFLDDGVGRAPALAGRRAFDSSFFERWEDATVRDMAATVVATMPQQKPASLSAQAYIDVVSYLLLKNGIPAGDADLPVDVEALGEILITPEKLIPPPS